MNLGAANNEVIRSNMKNETQKQAEADVSRQAKTPFTDAAKVMARGGIYAAPWVEPQPMVPVATSEQLERKAEHYRLLSFQIMQMIRVNVLRGTLTTEHGSSLDDILAEYARRYEEGEKLP